MGILRKQEQLHFKINMNTQQYLLKMDLIGLCHFRVANIQPLTLGVTTKFLLQLVVHMEFMRLSILQMEKLAGLKQTSKFDLFLWPDVDKKCSEQEVFAVAVVDSFPRSN